MYDSSIHDRNRQVISEMCLKDTAKCRGSGIGEASSRRMDARWVTRLNGEAECDVPQCRTSCGCGITEWQTCLSPASQPC